MAQTLTAQAVDAIRQGILRGELVPGTLYTAGALGEKLCMSRTPVREACQELSRRGLVRTVKNRGVEVVSTSAESFVEIFQIRVLLEGRLTALAIARQTPVEAARVEDAYEVFQRAAASGDSEATLRADRDFHDVLIAGAGNSRARHLLAENRDVVLGTGIGTVPVSRSPQDCLADHDGIIAAYRAGDPRQGEAAMTRHIIHTAEMLLQQEAEHRPEFGEVDISASLGFLSHASTLD
ncbi:FCD domain-containing protein [Corynebacterium poyangense]|uniref:FCD domain-containing protein n=1 Tax=Corynebacterium poyangense TaxID=2684405 RepID=A0A7H0SL29_9CORY|nr:GntR family transcriptional regulator [Corynebacterium poyangense]MBZ8177342.1 FCD domain-containing protein [Corynebacterium poyangense]QNQ89254.1 FCD domain-containing protein [Corynebacterium poyangense]